MEDKRQEWKIAASETIDIMFLKQQFSINNPPSIKTTISDLNDQPQYL